jgi:hypothetical protein
MAVGVLILAVVLGAMCGGCSGLQARGDMATQISSNAATYGEVVKRVDAGTLPAAEARVLLPKESVILDAYYDAATTNVFTYWFGKATIYASPAFYLDLKTSALNTQEMALRATDCSDASAIKWAGRAAKNIVNVDLARKGVKE